MHFVYAVPNKISYCFGCTRERMIVEKCRIILPGSNPKLKLRCRQIACKTYKISEFIIIPREVTRRIENIMELNFNYWR